MEIDAEWIAKLVRCRRLVCRFETTTYTDNSSNKAFLEENWYTFSRRLHEILSDTPSADPYQARWPRLRFGKISSELCVRGHFKFHIHLASLLSIPMLCQSITMLDLHFNNFDTIDPTLFFHGTPSNTAAAPILPLPNLRHLYLHKVFIVEIDRNWQLVKPSILYSLSLESVRIERVHFFTLMKNLCGPKLTHLRLKNIFIPDSSPTLLHNSPMGGIPFRNVNNLAVNCPQLKSLEVDHSTTVKILDGARALTDAFPNVQVVRINNWNFYYHWVNTTSAVSSSSPNDPHKEISEKLALTRIDIRHPNSNTVKFELPEFRKFMHDSTKCQYLQELTALHLDISVDLLTPNIPWQCRHLQILRLGFSAPLSSSSSFATVTALDTTRESKVATSRRIFGFITTTFPSLRHLTVRGPICISETAGGFCYLSRLRSLETITLRGSAASLWGMENGKPKKSLTTTNGMEEPRWMLPEVKAVDRIRRCGSLRQCRALTELDMFGGFFGSIDGKEMLWPSNKSGSSSVQLISDGEQVFYDSNIETFNHPCETSITEGCSWERMEHICFELTDSYPLDQAPVSTSLEMMRSLRPDLHFHACHVTP
ncbi:hypothetical protein BGW42_002017 [Actinomortierella wolfii]|nr:hypothetical protein BGW42_002017 [Actinomortierella wolfii]